jgi:membrane associated rhomboid family serine protease
VFGANALIPIHDQNPTRTFSWLTVALIAANVVVFFMEPGFGQPDPRDVPTTCAAVDFFYQWGLVPREIATGEPVAVDVTGCPADTLVGEKSPYLAILTSMFVHGGWIHIIGNMLFLWVFGNNIEDRLGKVRYLIFYLLAGVVAALAHTVANLSSAVPTIGASGAVAGLLGAYLILFPRARITTVVPLVFIWPIVRLPAMVVLGFWFVSQFFISNQQPVEGGGVAWLAHVGGFVAGVILIIPFGGRKPRRKVPPQPPW